MLPLGSGHCLQPGVAFLRLLVCSLWDMLGLLGIYGVRIVCEKFQIALFSRRRRRRYLGPPDLFLINDFDKS